MSVPAPSRFVLGKGYIPPNPTQRLSNPSTQIDQEEQQMILDKIKEVRSNRNYQHDPITFIVRWIEKRALEPMSLAPDDEVIEIFKKELGIQFYKPTSVPIETFE